LLTVQCFYKLLQLTETLRLRWIITNETRKADAHTLNLFAAYDERNSSRIVYSPCVRVTINARHTII